MAENLIHVLLVEDNDADADLVRHQLARAGEARYRVEHVDRVAAARERLGERDYDVVLLDLTLPDSEAGETISAVLDTSRSVPIVVLSGLDDEQLAERAVHAGAQDYLVKGGTDPRLLHRTVRYAIERRRLLGELELRMEVIYAVAHDLKAPLFTISGFLDLMKRDLERENIERVKSDLLRVQSAVTSMRQLLSDILELAEAGRPVHKPQEVELGELARNAEELVGGRIRESGAEVMISAAMPRVMGDRRRLSQVFLNLLDNAVKYLGEQPIPLVEIGVDEDGSESEVICFVRDNGVGVEPDSQERIFDLFEKLSSKNGKVSWDKSSGVGLALVKRIVEGHGGRVWVESEGRGQGSTFFFTLPRAPEADTPAR